MCDPISIAVGASAVIGAGSSLYSGAKQRKAMKKANRSAEAQAAAERARQTRETNRLNQKQPDIGALARNNSAAAAGGVGSTMLTGPYGAPLAGRLSSGVTGLLGSNSALGA